MKIEFSFDETSQISLIHSFPETRQIKLLGYNGIGKSLTANLLSTISREPVWLTKEKLDSLSNFLSNFIVKIQIENKNYKIECNIKNWEIEDITGKIKKESLGKILLNGSNIDFEQFWDDFKCIVTKGNEDLGSQIALLLNNIKRVSLDHISQLENSFTQYQKELDFVQSSLQQESLYLDILKNFEFLSKTEIEYKDIKNYKSIKAIAEEFYNIENNKWFSLRGPEISLENLLEYKKQLTITSNTIGEKISLLHNKIPEKQKDYINKLLKQKKQLVDDKESIKFDLNKDEYNNEQSTSAGKIKIMNRLDEKKASLKDFVEDNFRKTIWSEFFDIIDEEIIENNLDFKTKVLLETIKRKSLSIEELKQWYSNSNVLSREKLIKIGNYHNLSKEIEELKELASQFDDHIDKLEKWDNLIEDINRIGNRLENELKALQDIQELPTYENKFKKVEDKLKKLDHFEFHLKTISDHNKWSDLFIGIDLPNDIDRFIEMVIDITQNVDEVLISLTLSN